MTNAPFLRYDKGERTCHLCGRIVGTEWELKEHLGEVHAVVEPKDAPASDGTAGSDEETGGTTERTEGGAGRVQTE